MQEISLQQITIDPVPISFAGEKEITIDVLRLDKIHPLISGNKWFKLRFYLDEARSSGKSTVLTFGGAWSNHIVATAAACQQQQLASIGIIRGEEPIHPSITLQQARALGMQLIFISRDDYARKKIPATLDLNDTYLIDEGGYGQTGAKGAATIAECFSSQAYTNILCAVGTGTMMAGLLNAVPKTVSVTGVSVLKNHRELAASIKRLLADPLAAVDILHDYHFGGYAKHTPGLIQFMNDFYTLANIPSDFVYTAKLFYAARDLARNNYFKKGSRVLLIHSGGLQGNASLSNGTLIF